jgi:hypothetical protein
MGFYYVTLSDIRKTGYGWSGLIVNYASVNGDAVYNPAAAGYVSYTSSCCMVDCSAWEGFGINRVDNLNRQIPPTISCSFKIDANTTGYILLNLFNTDWDYSYAARFSYATSDHSVRFVDVPQCLGGCYVNATTAQWFRFGFQATPAHDRATIVTLSITVTGY